VVNIRQGQIYWVDLGEPAGSEPAGFRPALIVQGNYFNRSAIQTVVVCLITSQLKREHIPGNVRLAKGEANLPKPSVVNVSQLYTLDRSRLESQIGTLSPERVAAVIDGIALLMSSDAL